MIWVQFIFMLVGACVFGAIISAIVAFAIYKLMNDDEEYWK